MRRLALRQSERELHLAAYESLTLWVHGGSGSNQVLRLSVLNGNSNLGDFDVAACTASGIGANTWHAFTLPFDASTGLTSGQFDRLQIMDFTGGGQATVYIDDIVLPPRTTTPPAQTQSVAVHLAANRRPINPDIYGVNFGSAAQHAALRFPVRRDGGNSTTRYHWQFDTHNTGSDWFYQNIPDGNGTNLPDDSTSNQFVATTRQYGGEPLVTATTIGWAPKDRVKRWGFSQAKYGPQLNDECRATDNAFWCTADAGDGTCNPGVNTTGYCIANPGGNPPGYIRNNDSADTSLAVGPGFDAQRLGQFAGRPGGAVRYVSLDNEVMLWNSTHRDVHPVPVDYDELWATRTVPYASALKAQDPNVKIFGPVTMGMVRPVHVGQGCRQRIQLHQRRRSSGARRVGLDRVVPEAGVRLPGCARGAPHRLPRCPLLPAGRPAA